mmetsp:Transcript_17580/g.46361  ORF Transcript_17580/g.46361 Transcript_17580/m.46361 type:complete len:152 (+) Transcript_17580:156-611(+)
MHLEKGFSIVACRCHEEDVLHRSFLTHDLGLRAGTIWTVWLVLAPNWLTRDSLNHMTEITINKFRSTSTELLQDASNLGVSQFIEHPQGARRQIARLLGGAAFGCVSSDFGRPARKMQVSADVYRRRRSRQPDSRSSTTADTKLTPTKVSG